MMHPHTRRPVLGLVALAGLLALVGIAAGFGDKIPPDPVDEFRRVLNREKTGSIEARRPDIKDNKARDYALDFRQRELERAADKLTTLSEIARALLLIWPMEEDTEFAGKARDIDDKIRDELLKRLVGEARMALRSRCGSRAAAAAIVIGEATVEASRDLAPDAFRKLDDKAVRRSRETLIAALDKLAPEVASLSTSKDPDVRGAVARALGQMPRRPYTSARGLDRILGTDHDSVANRRAAAAALGVLVQASTGTELLIPSEPGITTRDTRRVKTLETTKDKVAVWAAIIPVAARGLTDTDVQVRLESAIAMHHAVLALAREISLAPGTVFPLDLKEYPPRGRKRSKEEEKQIQEALEKVKEFEEQIKPAIGALTVSRFNGSTVAEALIKAACDTSTDVSVEVRRVFEEIARARRALQYLRELLIYPEDDEDPDKAEKLDMPKDGKKGKDDKPKEGKNPEKDDPPKNDKNPKDPPKDEKKGKPKREDITRRPQSSLWAELSKHDTPNVHRVYKLPPPPREKEIAAEDDEDKPERLDRPARPEKPARPDQGDQAEKLDMPANNNKKNAPEEDTGRDDDPFKDVKVQPDALGKLLLHLAEEVIRSGVVEPNPAGRRASVEGVEAMGDMGKLLMARLLMALKDQDRFVRWAAARTLGKMAPSGAKEVVPALIPLLEEIDLDVRIAAIEALGLYNSSASCAVPNLAGHLGKGDAESRLAIFKALENIGAASLEALPSVRPLLGEQDARLRAAGARFIGLMMRFNPKVCDYIPDVQKLLRDPDLEVRRAAAVALGRMAR